MSRIGYLGVLKNKYVRAVRWGIPEMRCMVQFNLILFHVFLASFLTLIWQQVPGLHTGMGKMAPSWAGGRKPLRG